MLAASTALVFAQAPTTSTTPSSKTLSGGGESLSGGSGAGPVKDGAMKAGSADSGNNQGASGASGAAGASGTSTGSGSMGSSSSQPQNQGTGGREPNTAAAPPKNKE